MKHDARLDLRLSTEMRDRVKAAAKGSVNAWVRNAILIRLEDEALTHRVLVDAPLPRMSFIDNGAEEIPLPKIAPRRWGS